MKKALSFILSICLILGLCLPLSDVKTLAVTDDIVVNNPSPATETSDGGLHLSKTLNRDATTGKYSLQLEAYTTGKVTTTNTNVPTDIILVLDQSRSMQEILSGGQSRAKALKNAANQFVESVYEKAVADKVDHRIGIVTYGSNFERKIGLTALYSSTDKNQSTKGKNDLKSKINALPNNPEGATQVDLGIKDAKDMFDADTLPQTGRQRVVIVFTDGVPTTGSDFDTVVADNAISTAKAMKDNGTLVYTIGVFANADKNQMYGTGSNGNVGSKWYVEKTSFLFYGDISEAAIPAGNRFLNLLSSNYKSSNTVGLRRDYESWWFFVTYQKETFTITANYDRTSSDYYLTADNTESLNSIFKSISNNITTPTTSLAKDTVIKDIISPYFNLPTGADADSIVIKTASKKADGTWNIPVASGSGVTAKVDGKTVSVTGFDFDKNVVTSTAKDGKNDFGNKLVITIPITYNPASTFGGNGIPSNDANSGVYDANDNCICKFAQPTIDAPIIYEYEANDQSIYLTQVADLTQSLASVSGFVPNGINNAFVDIEYNVGPAKYTILAGTTKGVWSGNTSVSGLEKDTQYNVTCTVTPKTNGTKTAATLAPKTANVFVFVPNLTTADESLYLGETVTIEDNTPASSAVKWVGNEYASQPTGTKPTIDFGYEANKSAITEPSSYGPEETTDVDVKVSIGGRDVTTLCKGHKQFKLTVNTCTIELVNPKTVDPDQTIIYTVTETTTGKSYRVSVTGSLKSRKVTGLPIGTYVVSTDKGWIWSYENLSESRITLNSEHPDVSKDFFATNYERWLSDENAQENVFNPLA